MTDDEREAERKRLTEKLDASKNAGPGYAARVKATGGRFESDWVMVLTLREGRVSEFREFTDSHQVIGAFAAAVV